jgi:hypothetical protein
MKNKFIYLILTAALFFTACSDEAELQRSVFIADKDFPNLPAYTEWGYNTFGAYYDRELFIYNEFDVPAKVINNEGKTSFVLSGTKGLNYSSYYEYGYYENAMIVSFDLIGFLPQAYTELVALNDSVIDLMNPDCQVIVTRDGLKYQEHIIGGTLHFKKVQNLIVDKEQVEVILSGTFEYQALLSDEPFSITLGRFDVAIGKNNFYLY